MVGGTESVGWVVGAVGFVKVGVENGFCCFDLFLNTEEERCGTMSKFMRVEIRLKYGFSRILRIGSMFHQYLMKFETKNGSTKY